MSETTAAQINDPEFWSEDLTSFTTSALQFCSPEWDFENVWKLSDPDPITHVLKAPYVSLIHTLPAADAE